MWDVIFWHKRFLLLQCRTFLFLLWNISKERPSYRPSVNEKSSESFHQFSAREWMNQSIIGESSRKKKKFLRVGRGQQHRRLYITLHLFTSSSSIARYSKTEDYYCSTSIIKCLYSMNDIALLALLFNRYLEYGAPPKHINIPTPTNTLPIWYT